MKCKNQNETKQNYCHADVALWLNKKISSDFC
jgi:hypothetical protein